MHWRPHPTTPLTALLFVALTAVAEPISTRIEPSPAFAWRAVNDAVMGGVSEGCIERTAEGTLVFHGRVSLENNGGFASARRPIDPSSVPAFTAITVRVRGDGQRYRLAAYGEADSGGLSYQAAFDTRDGAWQTVTLPLAQFRAGFRGRAIPDAPPLTSQRIRALGFLISDKQAGPFRLEVASIDVEPR